MRSLTSAFETTSEMVVLSKIIHLKKVRAEGNQEPTPKSTCKVKLDTVPAIAVQVTLQALARTAGGE